MKAFFLKWSVGWDLRAKHQKLALNQIQPWRWAERRLYLLRWPHCNAPPTSGHHPMTNRRLLNRLIASGHLESATIASDLNEIVTTNSSIPWTTSLWLGEGILIMFSYCIVYRLIDMIICCYCRGPGEWNDRQCFAMKLVGTKDLLSPELEWLEAILTSYYH